MDGTRGARALALGAGLALAAGMGVMATARMAKAQAAQTSVAFVYAPPRQLYVNFWVPGAYAPGDFSLTLNGQKTPFHVVGQSTLSVQSPILFGSGLYRLSGSLTLPQNSSAIFPAAASVMVVNHSGMPNFAPPALDQSSAVALDAINALRQEESLAPVAWSSSLELAALHHRAYLSAHHSSTNLWREQWAKTDFTGTSPRARANLSGYLGDVVKEWDGTGVAVNPLSVVSQLNHGVLGRFFLMDGALLRMGLAIQPEGTPVIDTGALAPSPLMANILADPGPNAVEVPTAWANRRGQSPWANAPAVTGYPVMVMLQGWNVSQPFSLQLSTASGMPVAAHIVADPMNPAMAALIPMQPLNAGQRYQVSASVVGSDPLNATTVRKHLRYQFSTVPSGLSLSTINHRRRLTLGQSTLVQLSLVSSLGAPVHVGASVHWKAGPGLKVVARTHRISPSGLAEALVVATHSGASDLRAMVGEARQVMPLTVITPRKSAYGVKTTRISGKSRLATVAAIAEATLRVSRRPSGQAILLAQNASEPIETLLLAPLAHALDAPLLLTENAGKLGPSTRRALTAMHVTRVLLVGANRQLVASLPASMKVIGRLAAKGPVSLAQEVGAQLEASGHPYHQAFVVANQSQAWADGLSIGPVAASQDLPIFLLDAQGQIPAVERSAFSPVHETFAIGAAERFANHLPGGVGMVGVNRYDTAILANHEFYSNGVAGVILASALPGHLMVGFAAADLAAHLGVPIIPTPPGTLSLPLQSWLSQLHFKASSKLTVIGGLSDVSPGVVGMVKGIASGG